MKPAQKMRHSSNCSKDVALTNLFPSVDIDCDSSEDKIEAWPVSGGVVFIGNLAFVWPVVGWSALVYVPLRLSWMN